VNPATQEFRPDRKTCTPDCGIVGRRPGASLRDDEDDIISKHSELEIRTS